MSRYSWIVLDADHTLFDFDTSERRALERTLAAFGRTYDDAVRARWAAISARLWRAYEGGEISSARLRVARFEELLAEGEPRVDPRAVSGAYLETLGGAADLLPDAEWVVRRLAASHRLLLATNGIGDVQRRRLGVSPIADCFRDVVVSDEIGVGKPHAGFFDEAFRRMGGPAKGEVLMVGDSLATDVAGGHAYGLDTCWFRPRDTPADGPDGATTPVPTYRIAALPELLRIVASPGPAAGTVVDGSPGAA